MKDSEFIRGKVPMTKEEVRAVVLHKLALQEYDTLLDIGAGTGSVGIEAALQIPKGKVIAIEHNVEALALIKENIEKHEVKNFSLIHAKAPEGLVDIEHIQKFFIGGSGGNLIPILKLIDQQCAKSSSIVISAIVIDTMYAAYSFFKDKSNYSYEIIQISVNKVDSNSKTAMLLASNPIFIITAHKLKDTHENR